MKENKYDDSVFFDKYSGMERSKHGLEAAGEWRELRKMLPDFQGKRVLDLGCGFGWHCRYAAEHGASSVLGVDISQKMLGEARKKTQSERIQYVRTAAEEIDFPADSFDVVICSLVLHYVSSFEAILERIKKCLAAGGDFVFSVEHPVFTAYGSQDWHYDGQGNRLHWPVDRYFAEGARNAVFLGEPVVKYHKTLTTYLNGLIRAEFEITGIVEPMPEGKMLRTVPGMPDELRRPMMLLVSAKKTVRRAQTIQEDEKTVQLESLLDVMYRRRSVRRYEEGKAVEDDKIKTLLRAAMAAPSACNLQPWEFIVVNQPEGIQRLKACVGSQNGRYYNAPAAFVVCANTSYIPWKSNAEMDCGAAIENILLAATAMGLGAVWIGDIDGDAIRKLLDIPAHVAVNSVVYLGYPAEQKSPRTQYDEQAVYWKKYDPERQHPARSTDLRFLE